MHSLIMGPLGSTNVKIAIPSAPKLLIISYQVHWTFSQSEQTIYLSSLNMGPLRSTNVKIAIPSTPNYLSFFVLCQVHWWIWTNHLSKLIEYCVNLDIKNTLRMTSKLGWLKYYFKKYYPGMRCSHFLYMWTFWLEETSCHNIVWFPLVTLEFC